MANGKSDWDLVMLAQAKMAARKIKWRREQDIRNKAVFGSQGTKMTCDEIQEVFKSGGFILDVRNPVDFMSGGRVHNATNVPLFNLVQWVRDHKDITEHTPILVYSNEGNTAQTELNDLTDYGYQNVTNIGTHKWYPMCS